MTELMADVSGTRVFVDDRGAGTTALLYVHGGPGQGAYDFMASVGDLLAEYIRVVVVDQRGCLRSDPMPAAPPISHEVLIEDFEAVRRHLGIERWLLIGHSAGGPLALKYALAHPDAVAAAYFLCATFDADLTDRYRLPVAARLLRDLGRDDPAERCEAFAMLPRRITAEDESYRAMQELGADYMRLFVHDETGREAYDDLWNAGGFSEEEHLRGLSHLPLVAAMYEPTLGLLPRLTMPHAVIHGVDDLVMTPGMVEDYRRTTASPRVVAVPETGHFPFVEAPEAFVEHLAPLLRADLTTAE